MIELREVSKRYHYDGQPVDAVTPTNLQVPTGQACCIYGQSGSGKSTLLHMIGGMLVPSRGNIRIHGTDITTLPLHFLSAFRRDTIGFIFQQFNLLPRYTVTENILFPLLPLGRDVARHTGRMTGLLERLGLSHRSDFPVCRLSGGEQQRVAVARALVADPAVIIADEPFSNLDPKNCATLLEIFTELKAAGKTIVLSAISRSGPEQHFIDQAVAHPC